MNPILLGPLPDYNPVPLNNGKVYRCCFCQIKAGSIHHEAILGDLIGFITLSFNGLKQKFCFHSKCALWTPCIALDHRNKLRNFDKAIQEYDVLSQKCVICGKGGASIGCFDESCPRTYHYLCAREDDAQFLPNYDFYCKDH